MACNNSVKSNAVRIGRHSSNPASFFGGSLSRWRSLKKSCTVIAGILWHAMGVISDSRHWHAFQLSPHVVRADEDTRHYVGGQLRRIGLPNGESSACAWAAMRHPAGSHHSRATPAIDQQTSTILP